MSYKVEGSKQVQEMNRAGGLTKRYRVWIVTDKGASGFLDVDAADWEADKLREKLDAFAKELDLAFNLEE